MSGKSLLKIITFTFVLGSINIVACNKSGNINQAEVVNKKITSSSLERTTGPGPIYVDDRSVVSTTGGCYCTEYVAYRIRGSANAYDFGHAKTFGTSGWLSARGYIKKAFTTTTLPQNKDVIIIQSGWGISPTYGHIGFVGSAYVSGSTITINIIGANQSGTKSLKCNCPNESSMPISGVVNNDTRIEIWRKSNPALACP